MKIKHLFLSSLALTAMVTVGCKKEEVLGPASLKPEKAELTFKAEGETQTFELKATRDWTAELKGNNTEGITVSPLEGKGSNDPVTITVTVAENKGADRTATIEFKASATLSASVTIKQSGDLGDLQTISDVMKLPKDSKVGGVMGTVVGINNRGFVMQDATGLLLVYKKDATAPGAAIGDVVKVSGTTDIYGELAQLIPEKIAVEKQGETVSYPEPLVITKDNISTIDKKKVSYIKMSGRYTMSGDYHNLAIEGTAVKGSISYPVATLGLDKLAGHNIDVYGYFSGGNNKDYCNILAVKVEDKGVVDLRPSTVKEVLDAAIGTQVKTSGTVMAVCKAGFIIKDETGVIYVLKDSNGKWTPDVKVGNKVDVEGSRGVYNEGPQISSPTYTVTDATESAQSYADAKDITGTLDSYVVSSNELVAVTGVMDKGRFVQPTGATQKVSLNYTVEDYSSLNGKTVTVRAYVLSTLKDKTTGKAYAISVLLAEMGADPFITVKEALQVSATATSAKIEVKSNVDWTVSCADSWIEDYTKNGSKNGEITVSFDVNSEASERTANFEIKSGEIKATFKLSQRAAGAADPVLVYTLTPTKGTGSAYKGEYDFEINNITWNITGNSSMIPWRIGGKEITDVDRALYSKTAISNKISKIEVSHGDATITVNSMKLTVHNSAADAATGANPVSTLAGTFKKNDVTSFEADADWTGKFYRIVYNVTNATKSNKYLEFKEAKFYEL